MQPVDINRNIFKNLKHWLNSINRKPLLLKGARQVGKSYTVKFFAKKIVKIENYVELNLEENDSYRSLFTRGLEPQKIIREIEFITGVNLTKPNSLLFIDEIQLEPKAIIALRYFCEKMPKLPVIAAGSLIEFVIQEVGIPVGRVDQLNLFPCTFLEFLEAIEKSNLVKYISSFDFTSPVIEPIHNELLHLLKVYFFVGGMPEAIKVYHQTKDLSETSIVHKRIITNYRDDFVKYASRSDWETLQLVFDKSVYLVGNQRVKYTDFDKTVRGEKIKKSLELLIKADVLQKVYSSDIDKPPLRAGKSTKFFKLLFLDIGLMQTLLGFNWSSVTSDSDLTKIKNGALAEQFVGQQILAANKDFLSEIFYWYRTAKSSNAEVDYLIEHDDRILPVEVKSGTLAKLKSLTLYKKQKNIEMAYVLSQRNVEQRDFVTFLPLYFANVLGGD